MRHDLFYAYVWTMLWHPLKKQAVGKQAGIRFLLFNITKNPKSTLEKLSVVSVNEIPNYVTKKLTKYCLLHTLTSD